MIIFIPTLTAAYFSLALQQKSRKPKVFTATQVIDKLVGKK